MHLHFERTINAKSDCPILSLTWMGKVPDELPENEGWKLNRTNYYQEGWLATGNVRGIVGVTFTTSHCKKNVDYPLRTNYNLRGHRAEVILVKWNEPYQKLASCDSSGIIFVWIKYEGRWSIELINDRNTPVTHFSWSHDGRMALICYQDGFVLVGSVAGQRYWSSMLNLEATITCGIWTPDDQQVYFGTTSGQIVVMDVHGAMVSQVQLGSEIGIASMAWSCEKFKMEEGEELDGDVTSSANGNFVLAVCLQNGYIYLLNTFDDVSPIQINTNLQGPLCMEWSNSREFLAVCGVTIRTSPNGSQLEYTNVLRFYTEKGVLLYSTVIPETNTRVSTLTWGHNDKRIFIATGTQIHIAWVSKRIASLQLLCRLGIHNMISNESQLSLLPLPMRLRNIIGNLFAQTIRCFIPEPCSLREFVSKPPMGSVRLHCTMIRHDDETNLSSGTCYTLYLEYLGGLVPLLKGKRISKIRPEFVIFDPQMEEIQFSSQDSKSSSSSSNSANGGGCISDSSDTEREDGCTGSPRVQRRKKRKNRNFYSSSHQEKVTFKQDADTDQEDLSYIDTLPEQVRLVEVTSNIWGTKFKIHGLATSVPANLGQVTYKTSLLHLQPRQMTLVMTELGDDFPIGPDPNFNPNLFSEDEEENIQVDVKAKSARLSIDNCPPIAPMSPRGNLIGKQKCSYLIEANICQPMTRTDSYDENNYSDAREVVISNDNIRPQTSSCTYCAQSSIRPNNSQSNSFLCQLKNGGQHINNQSRYGISPLCCDVSVPTLQSPKNAVAPSDIIFDRPPATTMVSYSSGDYFNSINNTFHVKSNMAHDFNVNSEHQRPIVIKKNDVSIVDRPDNIKNMNSILLGHQDLNFIDDDKAAKVASCPSTSKKSPPTTFFIDPMVRSCSVGYLDMVEAQLVPNDASLLLLRKDCPKRLVLVNKKQKTKRQSRLNSRLMDNNMRNSKLNPNLKNCGKSKSLDSTDIFPGAESSYKMNKKDVILEVNNGKEDCSSIKSYANVPLDRKDSKSKKKKDSSKKDAFASPVAARDTTLNGKTKGEKSGNGTPERNGTSMHTQALVNLEKLISRLKEENSKTLSPAKCPRMPRSSPASPSPSKKGVRPQSASPIRTKLLNSPLLGRRYKKNKNFESSDDEVTASGDEIYNGMNYRDLETFQKSQLRQKLKRVKIEPNGSNCNNPVTPQRREFVMHNKAPMWNENSQVYQLDFGGRVTQESAKNFQIEFRGKQVMQFGRIDGNAYTLDFQYPFSALQAFAVALANVTQRLK